MPEETEVGMNRIEGYLDDKSNGNGTGVEGLSEEEKTEILRKVQRWWDDSEEGLEERLERGEKCLEYRLGGAGMWDQGVLDVLRSEGRPAVSLNDIAPDVEYLNGIFWQNQKDIKAYNRQSSTTTAAEVLTQLIKHVVDQSHGVEEMLETFEDGNVNGIGWLQVMRAKDPDDGGMKLIIRRRSPGTVMEDPDRRDYDLNNDCKWIHFGEWVDKDEIEAEYPDKKETLTQTGKENWVYKFVRAFARTVFRYYGGESKTLGKYRYFKRYTWWNEYRSGYRWIDNETGEHRKLWRKDDIEKAKVATESMADRFELQEEKKIKVLCHAIWIDDVLLEYTDNYWDCDCSSMGFFNYSSYWKDGYAQGIVDNLISIDDGVLGPCELTNKAVSGALHILNQGANAPILKEQNSLTEEGDKNLEDFGSKPGVIIEYKEGRKPPEWKEPPTISTAHTAILSIGDAYHKKVTGINDQNLGNEPKKDMSGVAIQLQQNQGLTVNESKFRRIDRTQRLLGELILELIIKGDIYTDKEIIDIVEPELFKNPRLLAESAKDIGEPPKQPEPPEANALMYVQQQNPQDAAVIMMMYQEAMKKWQSEMEVYQRRVEENARKKVLEEVRNMRLAWYGVKVAESQTAVTRRIVNRIELENFEKLHPGLIDPAVLAEAMDLPEKDRIIESIKQRQQMAAQQAQMEAQAAQMQNFNTKPQKETQRTQKEGER